jgi:hypothetical protein
MAQGAIKTKTSKSAPKKGPSHHNAKGVTKRGSLQMNPRKAKLQKQAKMNKKLTSGLTAQTERMLSEKAGHMELIGKGRKKGGETKEKDGGKKKAK